MKPVADLYSAKRDDSGYAVVLVVVSIVVLLAFTGFALDVGNSLRTQRSLQNGTDSASLAAVLLFTAASHTDSEVDADVTQTLGDNGFTALQTLDVNCGIWDPTLGSLEICGTCAGGVCPTCLDCSDSAANAVNVNAAVAVPTMLARLLGRSTFFPAVSSTAFIDTAGASNCIRPFGVELQTIDALSIGGVFTVGNNAPANWGKIDLGVNSSSGKTFEEAMLTSACESAYQIGNDLSPGTGFGGPIRNVFDQVIDGGVADMDVALVSPFPNGNSGNVTIMEFARIRFLHDNGKNGINWAGTFEVLERNISPPVGGGGGGAVNRMLVQ